jgi:hypothetical protein
MQKRALAYIAFALSILDSSALTAASGSRAEAVIDNAMTAMGGRELLTNLKSLQLDTHTVSYRLDDSERHDGPPWLDIIEGTEKRDEVGGRTRVDSTNRSAQWVVDWHLFEGDGIAVAGNKWHSAWLWNAKPILGAEAAMHA